MTRSSRRRFLCALGAGAAFAVFGGGAAGAEARGAARPRPRRFIGVYTPHGRAHELWQPRVDPSNPAIFDIAYPESSLAPFDDAATFGQSFKDRLLVLDGVDLAAGIAVGTTGHDGPRVILTGSGGDGKNPSIDQFLAVEQGLGAETPHTSLVLGVGNDQSNIGSNISYAAGGTPLPKWIDPAQTFSELFGASLTGAGREQLERERRLGRSVLDVVRGDLARIRARAPRSEKTKLEQHATALREIEKRLADFELRCDPPAAPDPARFPELRAYGGGERYFDVVTDLQIDLLARAMACDLTRFATLFLADLSRSGLYPSLPDDVHGEVAHRYDARSDGHPGKPETWRALALQNRYTYTKVARLLQRLHEAGVLDETIVYVQGDMGDPARHSSRSVPTLIAGGAGGVFEMGRYLDFRSDSGGIPNNRLLVSICEAFGVVLSRYGHSADPRITTGRLDELFA